MKKVFFILSLATLVAFIELTPIFSQDQPKPQKDTVNIDTDAKPKTYYEMEDESESVSGKDKGSGGTIGIILGAVVVGAVAFFLLKKKK